MTGTLCRFAAACGLLVAALFTEPAFAQKQGGILKMYDPDSRTSMSIHEGTHFAQKINALIMRWDSFSFAVSHTFSK